MRSLVGLIAIIAIATLYLYFLSQYLPAGPRRRPRPSAEAEHVETEAESQQQPADEPNRLAEAS